MAVYPATREDKITFKQLESTNFINITDFIHMDDVNPEYFYKPYFLEAQKSGEKGLRSFTGR